MAELYKSQYQVVDRNTNPLTVETALLYICILSVYLDVCLQSSFKIQVEIDTSISNQEVPPLHLSPSKGSDETHPV